MVETRNIGGATASFRYEEGVAPALVCVHGSADNHHAYDRLIEALPGRRRYAIDLPGRVGSDGPPLENVADMEGFVSRFVESEVQDDYVVMGHSLGGAVAIEHALATRSKRLQGIVLLATGARLRVHPMILQLFDQAAASGETPPLPPGVYEAGADPEMIATASKHRQSTPVETGKVDWRAADGFDRMQDLRQIRVPTLILAGSEDELTPPKYARHLAANIPGSQLCMLQGAGHMLVMERADEVSNALKRFLR